MCWLGNINDKKFANEDVTVYKILAKKVNGKYIAPIMGKEYKIGERYKTSLRPKESPRTQVSEINEGFHSFNKECIAFFNDYRQVVVCRVDGTYLTTIRCSECTNAVVAKCTIPRGSTYYENRWGNIVSDSLIVNDVYRVLMTNQHFYEVDK